MALHVVNSACERPGDCGRSLCQWDCAAIARTLVAAGLVEGLCAETVRRILRPHTLKPWRHHLWLAAQRPRAAPFARQVQQIADLYTRPLAPWAVVWSRDAKTNLQPRTRLAPPRPARRGRPVAGEHEYKRCGALNLFAAFDTRRGHVGAPTAPRKRPVACMAFLEHLDREIPASLTSVHLVLDTLRLHSGALVRAWRAAHPRFVCHCPPVHGSWMNQVEQWFRILQRQRLHRAAFAGRAHLAERWHAFVTEWYPHAHPFTWSTKSVAKVLAQCARPLAAAA